MVFDVTGIGVVNVLSLSLFFKENNEFDEIFCDKYNIKIQIKFDLF